MFQIICNTYEPLKSRFVKINGESHFHNFESAKAAILSRLDHPSTKNVSYYIYEEGTGKSFIVIYHGQRV